MQATAWLAVGAAVLWLLMSLTYPFGWDQGLFSWAGGVIVRGGMPYVDAWDMKGPLVYYVYAAAERVFGVHLWSIRIVDAIGLCLTAAAIARIVAAGADRVIARWAALLFVLWYASQSYWHTAQPDGWTGMVLIIAIAPLLTIPAPLSLRRALVIGAAIGLTTLFKPLWAAFLVLPLLHVAMTRTSRRIPLAAGAIAGWLLPIAIAGLWFWSHGALDELIAVHLRYSSLYAGQAGAGLEATQASPGRLRGLVDYVLTTRVIDVALPVIAYGAVVLWRRHRAGALVAIAWIAIVIAAVVAQNRFFAYHWLPLLPVATVLGALGLHDLLLRAPRLAQIVAVLLVIHCVAPIALEESRFVSWMAGRTTTETYYAGYGEPGDDMKAVSWLRQSGQAGGVYVFGWEAGIVWLSHRPFVSRFGFSMPLLIDVDPGLRDSYRRELLQALDATPPRYIVVGRQSARIMGAAKSIADFPELSELIARAYQPAVQFGPLAIYERRP